MANAFTSSVSKNVGTSAVSVYTATASSQTTLIGLTVANTSVSNVTVDVYITRSAVDYYLVKGADVTVGGALVPIGGDQKVVLIPSDIVKVKSSLASSLDVVLSMLVIT
jgi:hypothetical protein